MKTPKVSVIIPAYNSEQFIGQTLDSVFNQIYRDFEIIVVDDGSKDGTSEILSGYKDRLTYIRKGNEGLSVARNAGIAQAQGEYIAFIDHDDLWLPEKLKEQVALLESNQEAYLCFSDAYIIDQKGKRSGSLFAICPPHKGMVFLQLLKDNFIPVLTAVVRKEAFKEIGLFDPQYRIAADWDLFLRIAKQYPVAFINRPLAEYRVHAGSFSRSRDIALRESISIISRYLSSIDKGTAIALKIKEAKLQLYLWVEHLRQNMKNKAGNHFLAGLVVKIFSSKRMHDGYNK